MRRLILAVCLALSSSIALAPGPAAASGWPVIDVANLLRAILDYEQQIRAYVAMVQQYARQVDHWKRQIKNMSVRDIAHRLLQANAGRDPRLGRSVLSALQYLDPNAPNWRDQAESVLAVYFALPDSGLHNTILEVFGGRAGVYLDQQVRNSRRRTPYLDPYHFVAAQEQPGAVRMETLDRILGDMRGLGDDSEVQQLQMIGTLLAMLSKQQEAQLDAVHMTLRQSNLQYWDTVDADTRVFNSELARLKKLQQSATVAPCAPHCIASW